MSSNLLAAIFDPAILLGLVPLLKLLFQTVFRRFFKTSALEAFEKAASPANIEAVRNAVANVEVRKALAQYVNNAGDLDRFFEICLFSGLSLVVWLILQTGPAWLRNVCMILLFVIIVALVTVATKAQRGSYEPGRKDVAKRTKDFAQYLNVLIVVLEVYSKLSKPPVA